MAMCIHVHACMHIGMHTHECAHSNANMQAHTQMYTKAPFHPGRKEQDFLQIELVSPVQLPRPQSPGLGSCQAGVLP